MLLRTAMLVVVWMGALYAGAVVEAGGVRYRGAVYEHQPHQGLPQSRAGAHDIMAQNLADFNAAAETASRDYGAQIIVFPEDGISGLLVSSYKFYAESVPSVDRIIAERIVPCNDRAFDASPVLQNLSCTASKYGIAVVANMPDLDQSSGAIYNTDVAMDTDGRLLMKYHKQHLFFEPGFTPGSPDDQVAVFSTSFGVRFGMCTCYDILFPSPCATAVARGATELAFPTAWINAPPLLYSTGIQLAFAKSLSVNVLAANEHLPAVGFTGSGIFAAGGRPLASYLVDGHDEGSKLLVAELVSGGGGAGEAVADGVIVGGAAAAAKTTGDDVVSGITAPPYKYNLLSPEQTSNAVCHTGFCCTVQYELNSADSAERFAIGAYNGSKAGQPVEFWMQACALVKCAGDTVESCSDALPTAAVATEFRSFRVAAAFDASVGVARLYPVAMTSGGGLADMTSGVEVTRAMVDGGNRWEMAVGKPLRVAAAGLFAHAATFGS